MRSPRFSLALERLQPSDWKRFEDLASKFMAAEYENLRTVASASGDRGRDAFLLTPEGDGSVLLQYSVASDWDDKILKTARRIRPEFPEARVLIYVTNQLIGAAADDMRARLRREFAIHLDVRDRSWFIERADSDRRREIAAEELAQAIVDPFLASKEVVKRRALALTDFEARAALVHLGLQWEDDTREKGLTKLSFEALVRSSLRETNPDKRKSRQTIREEIRRLLPSHVAEEVNARTDGALTRLTKKYLRHYEGEDEFCLTYEERVRLTERLAEMENADQRFQGELENIVRDIVGEKGLKVTDEGIADLLGRVRRTLEKFLLSRGEQFVRAVKTGELQAIGLEDLSAIVIADVGVNPDKAKMGGVITELVSVAIRRLLTEPSEAGQHYLRLLADAYTLFAFLRETADVQGALLKLFYYGDIWLDTTVLLPIFAEDLMEVGARRFSKMLLAAHESGQTLHITPGVLEELRTHIDRSIRCWRARSGEWQGQLPFLYSVYVRSGRAIPEFGRWIEQFAGPARPMDDIAEYLNDRFGTEIESLEAEAASMPAELRGAVQEVWYEAHERRRRAAFADVDAITLGRLVAHDVENYLGVIARRAEEGASGASYGTWWLTLDRVAFSLRGELDARLTVPAPDSPVMSPDFLVNYLAFGPVRGMVSKATEAQLPIAIELGVTEFLPPQLTELAERVRADSQGLPERLIQRRVRDAVDAAKQRRGPIAEAGLSGIPEGIKTDY